MTRPIVRFHPLAIIPTHCLRCGRDGAHVGKFTYGLRVRATKFWTIHERTHVIRAPRRMCIRCAIWSQPRSWMSALTALFVFSVVGLDWLGLAPHTVAPLAAIIPLLLAIDRIVRWRVVKVVAIEPGGVVALRNVHPDAIADLVGRGAIAEGVAPPVARTV